MRNDEVINAILNLALTGAGVVIARQQWKQTQVAQAAEDRLLGGSRLRHDQLARVDQGLRNRQRWLGHARVTPRPEPRRS